MIFAALIHIACKCYPTGERRFLSFRKAPTVRMHLAEEVPREPDRVRLVPANQRVLPIWYKQRPRRPDVIVEPSNVRTRRRHRISRPGRRPGSKHHPQPPPSSAAVLSPKSSIRRVGALGPHGDRRADPRHRRSCRFRALPDVRPRCGRTSRLRTNRAETVFAGHRHTQVSSRTGRCFRSPRFRIRIGRDRIRRALRGHRGANPSAALSSESIAKTSARPSTTSPNRAPSDSERHNRPHARPRAHRQTRLESSFACTTRKSYTGSLHAMNSFANR